MDQALSDVKVLDFTHHTAGPHCTKLLAGFGADVIKVERPGSGDPTRQLGPFPDDVPDPEKSGLFLHLNTNKRGITLNLKTTKGRDVATRLVRWADIVVESFRPGVMASFGLDYPAIKAISPAVVTTSISNFGQTGPYRDYQASEIIFYGMGGEMCSTGLPEREPLKLGGRVGLYQASTIAAIATIGAFMVARYQGVGQQVDISIMETHMGSQDRRMPALVGYQYSGETTRRTYAGGNHYPQGVYPCRDGYFEFAPPIDRFHAVRAMMGNPPFMDDPRWESREARSSPELKEQFEVNFLAWCLEHTKAELWQKAQAHRLLSGPLNTVEDLANDPVFEQRGAFEVLALDGGSPLRAPGRPFAMSATPWRLQRPAPRLGEHNQEVLELLGYDAQDIRRLALEGVL